MKNIIFAKTMEKNQGKTSHEIETDINVGNKQVIEEKKGANVVRRTEHVTMIEKTGQ